MPALIKRSATSTPRPRRPAAKTAVKPTGREATSSASPSLRFHHPESLRKKTLAVLTTIEKAKDGTPHRNALADLVVELTDAGMDYYFLRPLRLAEAGFLTEQSASLGMAATTRVLGSVIRGIIGRMDHPQLLVVCGHMRQLMK